MRNDIETKIKNLRDAAIAESDLVVRHICDVALGCEDPILAVNGVSYPIT